MEKTLSEFSNGITHGLHTGGQLTVVHRGKLVCDTAFGEIRPDEPMPADALLLWMSAGKPLAAIAALQQAAAGRIGIDTRVAEVIPEFAAHGKDAITLRHLLTHTGGFRGPLNNFTPGSFEDILARVYALRQEPGWIPGEKAGYHVGSSWFVLAELVRRLDGRPFEQYVREAVLRPVGASDSSVGLSAAEASTWAERIAPLRPDTAANHDDGLTTCRPGANARGPTCDLAAVYVSLLHHDGRLLPPEWSRQMVARQREALFDETFKQTMDWGWGVKLDGKRYGAFDQYGYGPHASDATFGHSGNQCGCGFADPEHDLVVAWVVNGMPGEGPHQVRQHAIHAAVYEDLGLA